MEDLVLPVDYRSPPFFGSWDQKTNEMLGYGKPKKKKRPKKKTTTKKGRRIAFRKKQYIQKYPSSEHTVVKFIDKPLTNFDLINLIKKLKIKHFRGIFSRDTLPNQINEPEIGIVNLDSHIGSGTHWICYRNVDKQICEYFDSFGLIMPSEIQKYLQRSDDKIIY